MNNIGIVVTCFNYAQFLDDCLSSIRRQGLAARVVVVDDASTEGRTEIDRLGQAHGAAVLHLPENRGLGIARNIGIAYLHTDWVLPLDADDWLADGALAALANAAAEHPACGIIYGDYVEQYGSRRVPALARPWTRTQLQQDNATMYCCLLCAAEIWGVGGYADCFTAEDWELQLRLFRAGVEAHHLAQTVFYHRNHGGNKWLRDQALTPRAALLAEWRTRVPELFEEVE